MALSMASGPSTRPPLIWPRSAIFDARIAASSTSRGFLNVDAVSTAEKHADLRQFDAERRAPTSIALCVMSTLRFKIGAMLLAASEMISEVSEAPGTSTTKAAVTEPAAGARSPIAFDDMAGADRSYAGDPS